MTAVARYSRELYDLLAEKAKAENIQGVEIQIYRGSITKLWNKTGASNAYYSKVMRSLDQLGCIQVVERGSGGRESVVALIRRPADGEVSTKLDLTPPGEAATLALRQEIEGLKKNIGGIDIAEAFQVVEKRLTALEREVAKNGKES